MTHGKTDSEFKIKKKERDRETAERRKRLNSEY